jgi:hypothetical protein
MRHPLRVGIRKAAEIGTSIGYSDLLSFRHGYIESGRMKSRSFRVITSGSGIRI